VKTGVNLGIQLLQISFVMLMYSDIQIKMEQGKEIHLLQGSQDMRIYFDGIKKYNENIQSITTVTVPMICFFVSTCNDESEY
jgi:hypothetical protein